MLCTAVYCSILVILCACVVKVVGGKMIGACVFSLLCDQISEVSFCSNSAPARDDLYCTLREGECSLVKTDRRIIQYK